MNKAKKTKEEKEAEKSTKRRNLINGNSNGNGGRIEPNINYEYWLEVSKKRQDNSSNGTFAAMLTILNNKLSEKDVIWDVIKNENRSKQTMNGIIKIGHQFANEIFTRGKEDNFVGDKQNRIDSLYLGVFDTVQGWGGITGRTPYTRRSSYYKSQSGMANLSARNSPEIWLSVYKEAVSLIENGDFMKALIALEGINGLKISFASKHLWFWANYFKSKGFLKDKSVHVYDTRIARMLFGRAPESQDYDHVSELYNDIIKNKNLKNMSHGDLEQALFAFSNTFYDNNLQHFHSDYNEDPISKHVSEDEINEAKRLFCIRNPSSCENGEPLEAFKDLRSVSDVSNEDEEITGIIKLPTNNSGIFATVANLKKGAKSKIYNKIKAWLSNPKNDIEKIEPKGSVYHSLKFIRDEPEPYKTTEDLKKEKAEQKYNAKEESESVKRELKEKIKREVKAKKEAESIEKKRKKKEDEETLIKAQEKEASLFRFPTDIDFINENTLKLKGNDIVFNFKYYESDLKKELERAFISTNLVEIRRYLRTVDPNYLNDNWREVQGQLL
jgi:hypothetical protein